MCQFICNTSLKFKNFEYLLNQTQNTNIAEILMVKTSMMQRLQKQSIQYLFRANPGYPGSIYIES
jgi:hypothetical protein